LLTPAVADLPPPPAATPDLELVEEPSLAGVAPAKLPPPANAVGRALAAPLAIPVAAPAEGVEERLRRLEETLNDLRRMQGSGAGRPDEQIRQDRPLEAARPRGSLLSQVGKRILAAAATPSGPVIVEEARPGPPRRPRAVVELLAELRAMYRMFVDPRYRLSLAGKAVPAVLLVALWTSWWWVPGTSIFFIGTILNKVVDLALAFVLFKVLAGEARRYRQTAPDLPPSLRL
jgi:hypothetical protein